MRIRQKRLVADCQYCGVEVTQGLNGEVWEVEDEDDGSSEMFANCEECDEGYEKFIAEFELNEEQYLSVPDAFGFFRSLNLRLEALEAKKVEAIKQQYVKK